MKNCILLLTIICFSCNQKTKPILLTDKGEISFKNGYPPNPMLTGVVLNTVTGLEKDGLFFVDIIDNYDLVIYDFNGELMLNIPLMDGLQSLEDNFAGVQFIDNDRVVLASWSGNFTVLDFKGSIQRKFSLTNEIKKELGHDFELNSSLYYSNLPNNQMLMRLWNSPEQNTLNKISYSEWLTIKYPFDFEKNRYYFIKFLFQEDSLYFELGGKSYYYNIEHKVINYLEFACFRVINDTIFPSSIYQSSISYFDAKTMNHLTTTPVYSKQTKIGHPKIEFKDDFDRVASLVDDNISRFGAIVGVLKWSDYTVVTVVHEPEKGQKTSINSSFSMIFIDQNEIIDELKFDGGKYDCLFQYVYKENLYIKTIDNDYDKTTFKIFSIAN